MNTLQTGLSLILRSSIILAVLMVFTSCGNRSVRNNDPKAKSRDTLVQYSPGTFGYDLEVLENHHKMILLTDSSGEDIVAVSSEWQGRVMTSTFDGMEGFSLGWINHDLIRSGEIKKHINPFGGEDRIWLGPEGGQFSLFFKAGTPFDLSSWQVPEEFDTKPFDVLEYSDVNALFRKEVNLINYSGFPFKILVDREIKLLSKSEVMNILKKNYSGIKYVAYESVNTVTNTGNTNWNKTTGAVSVWILGMFKANEQTTVVIPIRKGDDSELGPGVSSYFSKIPPERLVMMDHLILFKGDGQFKCKIGISPERALPYLGAYDEETRILTIVQTDLPGNKPEYVNSLLEIQDNPFNGDVFNSYNDGPAESGEQLGSYFELETSSPAAFLAPGDSITHINRTIHLTGSESDLDKISRSIFNTSLAEIKNAF